MIVTTLHGIHLQLDEVSDDLRVRMTAIEESLTHDRFQVASVSDSQRGSIENNFIKYMSAWRGVAADFAEPVTGMTGSIASN
jgi:hypothetical protein